MNKLRKAIIGVAAAGIWAFALVQVAFPSIRMDGTLFASPPGQEDSGEVIQIYDAAVPLAGGASLEDGKTNNGWLSVAEGQLVNDKAEPFQLRGMSSHGISWYPQYTGIESIASTKTYGANVFRVAMYADDDAGNYNSNAKDQETNKTALYAAVDNALRCDMYAIIDWHVLNLENPLANADLAVAFFDEVSRRYAEEPGVIYEICNEPNGETTWEDITAYAERVVPVIRDSSPKALIIVGTPQFSSDLGASMESPLPYENVMYAYHYYSRLAEDNYQYTLDAAMEAKHPVFVSEWGVGSDTDGIIESDVEYAEQFVAYLNEHGISWVNWSLCNKDESFSAIRPDVSDLGGWVEDDLTTSGRIAFGALKP